MRLPITSAIKQGVSKRNGYRLNTKCLIFSKNEKNEKRLSIATFVNTLFSIYPLLVPTKRLYC